MAVIRTPIGFGHFDLGRFGFGRSGFEYLADVNNNINFTSNPYHINVKTPSDADAYVERLRANIKNVSNDIITINRLHNIPSPYEGELTVLRLIPGATASVILDAYDSEQITVLRRQLKLLVDPVR